MTTSVVYAAEDQWSAVLDRGGSVDFFGSRLDLPVQRRFGSLDAIREYVEHVLALPFVAGAFPSTAVLSVRERRGQARAHYEVSTRVVAIPMNSAWAARETVVLHEIAHHLVCCADPTVTARSRPGWHGIAYRRAMCGLVSAVLGAEAELLLRAGYEGAGLRTVTE